MVVGGVYIFVVFVEVDLIYEKNILMLVFWVVGMFIIDNGYLLNNIFCVLVCDVEVVLVLINYVKYMGFLNIVLVLERIGWGCLNFELLI